MDQQQNLILEYLNQINQKFVAQNATEHSYRSVLENYLQTIYQEKISIVNEPKRQKGSAPDFILQKNLGKTTIPIGYIETKDITADLDKLAKTEQMERYKEALNNLIFTNYLDFIFYKNGEQYERVQIAKVKQGEIIFLKENFLQLEKLLQNFITDAGQNIDNSKDLAKKMASNAKLLAFAIEQAINSKQENQENNTLKDHFEVFRETLIKGISTKEFADIYAQTIAYGMFAARLHDKSFGKFSRQKAAELIPKTNPFLRNLFQYIAGYELDSRISWIVDSLAEVFRATDLFAIFENFGKSTKMEDPIIHFYEDFLIEYDPKLRKSRGVWYTPKPVVSFIVRAVDEVLKTDFNLKNGIADKSKINKIDGEKKPQEFHRVQILDPATGTGTFLAEIIEQIHQKFVGQEGAWSGYVEDHLIPRLNGFELLMASYAMAHLQLDLVLGNTGYLPSKNTDLIANRFRVYLTNSLENSFASDTKMLLARWLENEATQANKIKREAPVMVVLGNPPYSGVSSNKGAWINDLVEDYKKEPNSKQKLDERNPKWINDDYVKFIRLGQYFIDKNCGGVLAFINPHSFLDNPTFRGMRFSLLKSFDKIYVLNLHGNSRKKEAAQDGSKDENVFDIMQGVSINIFIKNNSKKAGDLAQVFHFDLFGKRADKYQFLAENSPQSINFKKLPNIAPSYFFVPKNLAGAKKYDRGFGVDKLFTINSVGIVTARDEFVIHSTKQKLQNTIDKFLNLDDEQARIKFNLREDVKEWQVSFAKKDLSENYPDKGVFSKISYRPFDDRWTFYTGNSKGFHCRPRKEVMQHFLLGKNVGLVLCKQFRSGKNYSHSFISNQIIESSLVSNRTSEINYLFPLYLYDSQSAEEKNSDDLFIDKNAKPRTPNLDHKIVKEISANLGLEFVQDENLKPSGDTKTFSPLNLLDYTYAILHSPKYRQKYREFLKTNFPKVPYPKDQNQFWQLVGIGCKIRKLHLLEGEDFDDQTKLITKFPISGSNRIEKIGSGSFVANKENPNFGKVFINQEQYFENVPLVAWQFFVGSYQPAQKWLKERVGVELLFEDILHYQKIIFAFFEAENLMQKIDHI